MTGKTLNKHPTRVFVRKGYSLLEANVKFLRFPDLRTPGWSFYGPKISMAALCKQLHKSQRKPKRMSHTSIVREKKPFPEDFSSCLEPETLPEAMPIPVTSKESKITRTVSDPAFCGAPKTEQSRAPQKKVAEASYGPWVNSDQVTILYCLQAKNDF